MSISFLFIFIILTSTTLYSQEIEWMSSGSGRGEVKVIINGNQQQASSIIEKNGKVYVAGLITGREGSAVVDDTVITSVYNAGFLVKYDIEGNMEWVKLLPTVSLNFMAIDNLENIYVIGNSHTDHDAIHLQKYDTSGSLIWEKPVLTNTLHPIPKAIVVDNQNDIIIAGRYLKISDSFMVEDSLVSGIKGDAIQGFFLKYDADGNFKWFRSTNTAINTYSSYCEINNMSVNQTDDIFFIGKMSLAKEDTLFFSSDQYATYKGQGLSDALIGKISKEGEVEWIREIIGKSEQTGNQIKVDDQGSVYFTGTFSGEISVENIVIESKGGSDFFAGKLTEDNHLEWIKTAGSIQHDTGAAVDIDAEGNVYFVGTLNRLTTFYSRADSIQISDVYPNSSNEGVAFVAKYDQEGQIAWVLTGNNRPSYIVDAFINKESSKLFFAGYFSPGATFHDVDIPAANPMFSNFFVGSLSLPTVTGLEQADRYGQVVIYPNPGKGIVNINVTPLMYGFCKYKLYDLQGNMIRNDTLYLQERVILDFSSLSAGIYNLVLVQDEKNYFMRIVIE